MSFLTRACCFLAVAAPGVWAGENDDPSGYSTTLRLLNHRWDERCPSWDSFNQVPPPSYPRALGPCPAEYQIIHLPPNFFPGFLMVAKCFAKCSQCSSRGPFRCREVTQEVKIWAVNRITSEPIVLDTGSRTIAVGCICQANLNITLSNNNPPQLVT